MLKTLHITAVIMSVCLFCIRFYWASIDSPMLKNKIVKILPHVVDSVLLLSAIFLAINLSQYPFYNDWLSVKVVALLLYIFLGAFALKWAKTWLIRTVSGLCAILIYVFIVSVALNKDEMGFFRFLY